MTRVAAVFSLLVCLSGCGDGELTLPLEDPSQQGGVSVETCRKSGCSSHVCSDQDLATTCEWRESYACYQSAECRRQADGACGFTMTDELRDCLLAAQ